MKSRGGKHRVTKFHVQKCEVVEISCNEISHNSLPLDSGKIEPNEKAVGTHHECQMFKLSDTEYKYFKNIDAFWDSGIVYLSDG